MKSVAFVTPMGVQVKIVMILVGNVIARMDTQESNAKNVKVNIFQYENLNAFYVVAHQMNLFQI